MARVERAAAADARGSTATKSHTIPSIRIVIPWRDGLDALASAQHEPALKNHSATGTRTRVARVRAEYPNQLDYSGCCIDFDHGPLQQLFRAKRLPVLSKHVRAPLLTFPADSNSKTLSMVVLPRSFQQGYW